MPPKLEDLSPNFPEPKERQVSRAFVVPVLRPGEWGVELGNLQKPACVCGGEQEILSETSERQRPVPRPGL